MHLPSFDILLKHFGASVLRSACHHARSLPLGEVEECHDGICQQTAKHFKHVTQQYRIAYLCAIFALMAGCHGPWSPTPAIEQDASTGTTGGTDSPATARRSASLDATGGSDRVGNANRTTSNKSDDLTQPAEEPNLADVLLQVQQAGVLDPDAQARLIRELQRSKPEMWPLVTEQFRASQAYHKQLVATETQEADTGATNDATISRTNLEARSTDYPITLPSVSTEPLANIDPRATPGEPPSSRIGQLVDPRGLRSAPRDNLDSWETVAEAGESGRVPAEFDSPATAVPIGSTNAQSAFQQAPERRAAPQSHDDNQTMVQARFESEAGERSEAQFASANESGAMAGRANAAVDIDMPAQQRDWRALVAKAIDDLEGRVAESPQTTAEVHEHASLRLLRMLAGRTEDALEPIPRISPTEQDFWSRQVFALATYLDHHQQPDSHRRAAASVSHLDDAVAKMRELGSLSLRRLAFCKSVQGYGAYEPYDDSSFAAGQQVSIYLEVENYRSVSTENGFATLFGASFEILDDQGERVDGGEFPSIEDHCRSRRRDFHIQYGLDLPQSLEAGDYRLQIVVKDLQSNKIGSAQLRFSVNK